MITNLPSSATIKKSSKLISFFVLAIISITAVSIAVLLNNSYQEMQKQLADLQEENIDLKFKVENIQEKSEVQSNGAIKNQAGYVFEPLPDSLNPNYPPLSNRVINPNDSEIFFEKGYSSSIKTLWANKKGNLNCTEKFYADNNGASKYTELNIQGSTYDIGADLDSQPMVDYLNTLNGYLHQFDESSPHVPEITGIQYCKGDYKDKNGTSSGMEFYVYDKALHCGGCTSVTYVQSVRDGLPSVKLINENEHLCSSLLFMDSDGNLYFKCGGTNYSDTAYQSLLKVDLNTSKQEVIYECSNKNGAIKCE